MALKHLTILVNSLYAVIGVVGAIVAATAGNWFTALLVLTYLLLGAFVLLFVSSGPHDEARWLLIAGLLPLIAAWMIGPEAARALYFVAAVMLVAAGIIVADSIIVRRRFGERRHTRHLP